VRPLAALSLLVALACSAPPERGFHGAFELVLLHTSDIHSELFPRRERIAWSDARRGLGREGSTAWVGGIARLAEVVRRERARAERSLLVDSGDAFQGSLAFDQWSGEAELVALSALGVQAQALGNHELDRGGENLRARYRELATFPLLAANYAGDSGTGVLDVALPFVVLEARGVLVGVIGVGNVRSVPALRERPNELGAVALEAAGAVQGAIDALRPIVDVIVVLTHLGLDGDRELVRATSGVDVILGGHQHLALDAPVAAMDCGGAGEGTIRDAWGGERRCTARRVLIVHSGAHGKYVGRLALRLTDDPAELGPTYDALDRHEVTGETFALLPVHAGLPEDSAVAARLEAYRSVAGDEFGLGDVLGFVPDPLERAGVTGADSPLGNLAASAGRWVAGSDLAVLGASSLRSDLAPGALDAAALERSFPFDDPLLRIAVTGRELLAAFEQAARTAAERDCRTPVHVAGAVLRLSCPCGTAACAEAFSGETEVCCRSDADCAELGGACSASLGELGWCLRPVTPEAPYLLATTGYLADGNGGLFEPVPPSRRAVAAAGLRESVTDALHAIGLCGASLDCTSACPRALLERARKALCGDAADCSLPPDACERALATCERLPCVDEGAGAVRDGRIRIERP
jgi:5'-nucleotidase